MISPAETYRTKRDRFIDHLIGQLPSCMEDRPPGDFRFDIAGASHISGLRGSRMYQQISELCCVLERVPNAGKRAARPVGIREGYETVGDVVRMLESGRHATPSRIPAPERESQQRESIMRLSGMFVPVLEQGNVVNAVDLFGEIDKTCSSYPRRKRIQRGLFAAFVSAGISPGSICVVGGESLLYDRNRSVRRSSVIGQLDLMELKHRDFPLYIDRIRNFRDRLALGLVFPNMYEPTGES